MPPSLSPAQPSLPLFQGLTALLRNLVISHHRKTVVRDGAPTIITTSKRASLWIAIRSKMVLLLRIIIRCTTRLTGISTTQKDTTSSTGTSGWFCGHSHLRSTRQILGSGILIKETGTSRGTISRRSTTLAGSEN